MLWSTWSCITLYALVADYIYDHPTVITTIIITTALVAIYLIFFVAIAVLHMVTWLLLLCLRYRLRPSLRLLLLLPPLLLSLLLLLPLLLWVLLVLHVRYFTYWSTCSVSHVCASTKIITITTTITITTFITGTINITSQVLRMVKYLLLIIANTLRMRLSWPLPHYYCYYLY